MILNFFCKSCILFSIIIIPAYAIKQDPSLLLLTPHYGVLNSKDLELYAKNMNTEPFDPKHSSGGVNYWQCFKSKNISIAYQSWIDDKTRGTMSCDMDVVVTIDNKKIHRYSLRSAMPLEYCERKKAIWKKIMKDQEYTCFGGNYLSEEKQLINGNMTSVSGWIFDRIKTKKRCNAYFGSDSLRLLECP